MEPPAKRSPDDAATPAPTSQADPVAPLVEAMGEAIVEPVTAVDGAARLSMAAPALSSVIVDPELDAVSAPVSDPVTAPVTEAAPARQAVPAAHAQEAQHDHAVEHVTESVTEPHRIQVPAFTAGWMEGVVAMLTTGDPLQGLSLAAARVASAVYYDRCSVMALVDEEQRLVYVLAASDEPTPTPSPVDLPRYPGVVTALTSLAPAFSPELRGGAFLVVPILVDKRAIGCLALRSRSPRPAPSEGLLAQLLLSAQLVGVALRGGRLLESVREQTQRISIERYAEKRRLRALEQYREFVERSADGVVIVDAAGLVVEFNRVAEQLTGYSRAGLLGARFQDFIPAAMREGLAAVLSRTISGVNLVPFDLELSTTSGEKLRLTVTTSTVLAEHGLAVLSFRDVSEARHLEDELRKTKDFLERLIDAAVDAIIAADLDGNVLVFNRGAERIFGYSAAEVIGKLRVSHLYPRGEARKIMAELRSTEFGGKGRLELSRRLVVSAAGERLPVSLAASIIYEDGREVATVGIIGDLRDRLRIEETLVQAQEKLVLSEKQAMIAELAGTTAHELNQPLTSVMGYTELLLKRLPVDDPNRRAIEIVLREAERMADIVRKIGKITRYETKNYVGSTNILDLEKSTTD